MVSSSEKWFHVKKKLKVQKLDTLESIPNKNKRTHETFSRMTTIVFSSGSSQNANLRGNFFDFLSLINSTKNFKEYFGSLIRLSKLGPVPEK